MNKDISEYEIRSKVSKEDASRMLERFSPVVNPDNGILMDIGCGPGHITHDILLSAFPKLKRIIAIDIMPEMIEYAKLHYPHSSISYHVVDAESRNAFEQWNGSVSIAFSFSVFHWLKNQEIGFQNIFNVLKDDGEAILKIIVKSGSFDRFDAIRKSPKWENYFKNKDLHIPESHWREDNLSFYKGVLQKIGFDILTCEEEDKVFVLDRSDSPKGPYDSLCPFTRAIPEEKKEDFFNDLFKDAKRSGRTESGQYKTSIRILRLHLRKTSKVSNVN